MQVTLSEIAATLKVKAPPVAPERDSVLLTYVGKIREINDDKVTVSLFAEEGEIVGELFVRQFPEAPLSVGQSFRYRAVVKNRGTTEVSILAIPETDMHADDFLDLWKETLSQIPPDDE